MPTKQPNILLFTTDQQRGDHLGIAGHPVVETPYADAFPLRGAYFPNAYTEIPSTTGARRCMLAGQGSYRCGLVGYSGVEWHERNTVAHVLADAGYHSINVGWRNLHPPRKLYGFHTVIPHDIHDGADDYLDWLRAHVGPQATEWDHGVDPNGWTARPWHLKERFHPTAWTTDATLDQIRKRDPTRPFFVWCSHLRPHSPYDPPQVYWDMYDRRELPEIPVGDWAKKYDIPNPGLDVLAWKGRLTPEQDRRMRIGYMGNCTHLDSELGRLMRGFNEMKLLNDTLIVFVSDHGDMMGDHHLHRKTYAYEGSARIVFLVRYPVGWDLPSGTFSHVVGLQDVMPTILEAAGVESPGTATGMSVLSAIRGERWREWIHGEHSPCYSNEEAMHFLTDGKEKFIWFPARGEEYLFDLVRDRQELHNCAADPKAQARVRKWRSRLIKLLGERDDGFSDGKRLIGKENWSAVVGADQA